MSHLRAILEYHLQTTLSDIRILEADLIRYQEGSDKTAKNLDRLRERYNELEAAVADLPDSSIKGKGISLQDHLRISADMANGCGVVYLTQSGSGPVLP